MAGPNVHLAVLNLVDLYLYNGGIIINSPDRSVVVKIIDAINADITRKHATWDPVNRSGNLFEKINELLLKIRAKRNSNVSFSSEVYYLAHYLTDCFWVGHWHKRAEAVFEPFGEVVIEKDYYSPTITMIGGNGYEESIKKDILEYYNTYFIPIGCDKPTWSFALNIAKLLRKGWVTKCVRKTVQKATEHTVSLVRYMVQ